MLLPGCCVSAGTLVRNYNATNVALTLNNKPSSRLRGGPIFKHINGVGTNINLVMSPGGPEPRITVLVRGSINPLLPCAYLIVILREILTTQADSWDRKIWSWVPQGSKPRKTVLAMASKFLYAWPGICKYNIGFFLLLVHMVIWPTRRVVTSTWWEGLVLPMIPRAMPAGA
jgi:hypothetical protein